MQFLNREATHPAAKTVIVLGCGRGGTSALAGALRIIGVAYHPGSHVLKHEGSPVVYSDEGVDRKATASNLRDMDAVSSLWGWKSPRDLFSVHSWVSMVRNPMFAIIWRGQLETACSAVAREQLDFEVALRHVNEVFAELGRFVFSSPFPMANVDYSELRASPRKVISELADWLGHTVDEDQFAAAQRFLLAGAGRYAALEGENIAFSPEEIKADQMTSHAALYGQATDDLEAAVRALDTDISKAEALLTDMSPSQSGIIETSYASQPTETAAGLKVISDYRSARGLFLLKCRHRAFLQQQLDAYVS